MDKKIFCVSLLGKEQVRATAAFKDDRLVIVKLEKISGVFGTWKQKLIKEIKKKHDQGFTILVEERGDMFCEYGLKLLLESSDHSERRAYMSIAFDLYFNLQRMQNIKFPQELQRHVIQESIVNVVTDDRGKNKYDVNQGSFNGYHRSILLCSLAALHVHQTTEAYMNEFLAGINLLEEDVCTSTLRAITVERDS